MRQLENFYCKAAEEIGEQEIRRYVLYCRNEIEWSPATMRIAYSGIKFFYTITLPSNDEILEQMTIKRITTLPTVLDVNEVRLILKTARTPQLKTFLITVYSCGLRRAEALALTTKDIDKDRMLLIVRKGKGGKYRERPSHPSNAKNVEAPSSGKDLCPRIGELDSSRNLNAPIGRSSPTRHDRTDLLFSLKMIQQRSAQTSLTPRKTEIL